MIDSLTPAKVSLNVNASAPDEDDWGGYDCIVALIEDPTYQCSFRGAVNYCINVAYWTDAATSADENRCEIIVAENAIVDLDPSKTPPMLIYDESEVPYNAIITVRGAGSGGTIRGNQIVLAYLEVNAANYDMSLIFSNVNFEFSAGSFETYNGGALFVSGLDAVMSFVSFNMLHCASS